MEKKTVSARLSLEVLKKLEQIQEYEVKKRFEHAGLNPDTVNKTMTIEWIIEYAHEKLCQEEGLLWLPEDKN